MSFTHNDFLFAKLFHIVKDIGSRTFSQILYDLYQEHPLSNKGSLPSKVFCAALQKNSSCKNIFGSVSRAKIEDLPDDYKFEVHDPCRLDISSLHLIFNEMAIVRKSSVTLHSERVDLDRHNKTKSKIDELEIKIKNAEKLEEFKKKFNEVLNEVKSVKDIRNELSHMNKCDEKVLISMKEQFDHHMTELYNKMALMFSRKEYFYNDLLKTALNDAKHIWEMKLSKDESQSFILECEQDDVIKFIIASKKELIKRYECFRILIPSFLNQESFANLYLKDIFTPVELYTTKKSLEYNSLLTCNSEKKNISPPAVVISGNAGLGKTTLCRKLTNDWCQGSLNMTEGACNYDLLLHIEAKKAKQKSLVDYLKNILLPETQNEFKYKKDDIISYLIQCNILFIIDGYDEKSVDASRLLDEIMTYFPNKKFLISTRPHYLKQIFISLQQKNLFYLNVNVNGFKEENRKLFIDNVWREMKNLKIECGDAETFKKYLDNDIGENLGELLHIPLAIMIIIYLWVSGKNKYKSIRNITFTNLYGDIFYLMKKRIINTIKEQCAEKNLNTVEKNIDNLLMDIAAECFRLTIENESSIDHRFIKTIRMKIKEYFELYSPYVELVFTSFFIFNKSLQKQDVSKMSEEQLASHLEFLHKTQIEYLTAFYIFNKMMDFECDNLLEQLFNVYSTDQEQNIESIFGITSYLIGLLSDKNDFLQIHISTIMDYLVKICQDYKEKFVACWKILYETKKYINDIEDFTFDKTISHRFLGIFPNPRWELHSYEVVSGLKLLAHTDIKIKKLEVKIPESQCTYEIPQFITTFSDLRHHMPQRYNKFDPLLLEFHFNGDLNRGTIPNDEILKALQYWGHLEKFTGLLGEEASLTLKYCYKLTNLHVRFHTKKALEDSIAALKDKKCLKRFNLYIHICQEESIDGYVPLNVYIQAKVCILFEGAVKENLSWVSKILMKLKPTNQLFHTISLLRTTLHIMDIEELIPTVKMLVSKKFTVHSTKDVKEIDILKISNSLDCEFDWLS